MALQKILLVSWGILPYKGGSSFIIEKLAKQFSPDEMVVLGEKESKPIIRDSGLPEFYYCPTSISLKGRGKRFFVLIRWLLFPILLFRMYKIVKKESCRVILAVFPDEYYLFAAYLVAKQKKIDLYTYFHNTYLENRNGFISTKFAKWLQPRVFSLSKVVFVISQGMKNYYENKYKRIRFEPLLHTFDKYLSDKYKEPFIETSKKNIKLVLVGNFNQSNVEATTRLLKAIEKNNSYKVSIYTAVPKWLLNIRGVKSKNLIYKGFIDDDKLLSELQYYDIMLLTHGFSGLYGDVEYQTIFPTRTIPFLISGKPIFAHSPKESFLNQFLRKYDCAEIVDQPDEEVIVETLDRLVDSPQRCRQLVKNAFKAADQFYGPNVAKKLKSIILNYN
ncbi:MAG: glycosyltransferase family 4 protein [Cytophagales bacterium]|nr:glycosyltransferase family 4 protein [Cytophagales bacterium]